MRKKREFVLTPEMLNDPIVFIETFCVDNKGHRAVLTEGQKDFIRNIGFYTALAAGRQWGKSLAIGWYATWFIVTHSNRQCMVIAPAVDQSRIIFGTVARQFRTAPLCYLLAGKVTNSPFPKITLKNGSVCDGRGANSPQYIRGNSPHLVVIDEAAFIKQGTIRELEPLMVVTGKEKDSGIICASTPFGLGEFYDLYDAGSLFGSPEFDCTAFRKSFHFTSFDNPHADLSWLEEMRSYHGESSMIWRTEYMAEFIGDEMAVFPEEDIRWAVDNWPEEYTDPITGQPIYPLGCISGHSYVSGVDLANTADYFVQTMVDTTSSPCVLVNYWRMQHQSGYNFYKEHIRTQWRLYDRPQVMIDATTLAEMFVEDMQDIGAKGYKFTGSAAKYDAVQALVKMFSEHRLVIPNDPYLLRELHYFTYTVTASKKIKMEAKAGHDDLVMSLALMALLAANDRTIGTFVAVHADWKREPVTTKVGPVDYWEGTGLGAND